MADNREDWERKPKNGKVPAGSGGPSGTDENDGRIGSREDLSRQARAMPGEILRDFAATLWFWSVMVVFWLLITGGAAWIGYGLGGKNAMWLTASIVGAVSPLLLAALMSFDVPYRVWSRLGARGRK
ncbi:hypothetical protein QWJ34_05235 [Saccharibacillus sp. CPCC 101409]|uniref:hypothetical protein n=1 Tax=Saccharibacillus sp. CPCC 101409 TaxID=3058041 RepID=UPI0026730B77|nr:hypothetical protein [Saccharibacillus sp. CPCC 101409]MDO3409159.1 hypothetical protein [Saccharibacillus sp. CPCC 101409]